jgi:hypothetical protein
MSVYRTTQARISRCGDVPSLRSFEMRGFYAWRKRPTCQHKREDARLTGEIRQVFSFHRERYGSPRIHAELKDQGMSCSRKRVARLMREGRCLPNANGGV